jgi:7-cyano-7-deazaguanine synthase
VKTLVLFSGGLDSAVVLASCVAAGDEVLAVGFDYGQPHAIELDRAAFIARGMNVPYEEVELPAMPLADDVVFAGRNMVMAAAAISIAHARGFDRIALGCNADDHRRFRDCRRDFWSAMRRAARAYDVGISAPLLRSSKRAIVRRAKALGVPVEQTWSCYEPRGGEPCGECLACKLRKAALCS